MSVGVAAANACACAASDNAANELLAGEPVANWMPAIATAVGCVICPLVAIWGFQREES